MGKRHKFKKTYGKNSNTTMQQSTYNMPVAPPPKEIIKGIGLYDCDGKVCKYIEQAGLHAFVQVELEKQRPGVWWSGKKIPIQIWQETCSFFEWTTANTPGESTVRLFHDFDTGIWKAWAFPQRRLPGLRAEEIEDHPERARQREALDMPNAHHFGSIHNHRDSGAFQSGTDSTDEHNTTGVHITIGGLGKPKYSIHGRLVMSKHRLMHEVDWSDWFDMPPGSDWIPLEHRGEALKWILMNPCKDTPFPEVWKTNMIDEPVSVPVNRSYGDWGYGGNHQSKYISRLANGEWLSELEIDAFEDWFVSTFVQPPFTEINEYQLAFAVAEFFFNELPICRGVGLAGTREGLLAELDKHPFHVQAITNKFFEKFKNRTAILPFAMHLIEENWRELPYDWIDGFERGRDGKAKHNNSGNGQVSIPVDGSEWSMRD